MSFFYTASEQNNDNKNVQKIESNDEDGPYEVIQRRQTDTFNAAPSISQIKRNRQYGALGNCGLGMRDSLIGFKEGVPGVYSGFRVARKTARVKSVPTLSHVDDELLQGIIPTTSTLINDDYELLQDIPPVRPPRKVKSKNTISQLVAIYDSSTEEDIHSAMDHVILETGEKDPSRVETGVRFYDPQADLSSRPASTIMLPMSLADDMSDSAESWDSDFDDSKEPIDEESEIYDVIGQPQERQVEANYTMIAISQPGKKEIPKPPLPPRHSIIFESLYEDSDLDKETYIPVEMEDEQHPAQLPPLSETADNNQIKRYQIIKCILENEKMYMRSLERLVAEYETPLYERKIISQDRIKVIFKHLHEIIQCHQLFNMALSDRTSEWESKEIIGDVIYASFSKSTVLKAYNSFVCNFSNAMDSIKETCKLVPAFLNFLKYRLYRHNTKQSLYDLMRQPLERIPHLVTLTQALVKVTPFPHPDRLPLQMALTHLECLSETLAEKRRDTMLKHKVRQLDRHCTGLEKPLASNKRYYIRHDDMLLCLVEDGKVIKTKLRRIFLLSDLLICTSVLTKTKQVKLMTNKHYKVKWCIPINDVNLLNAGSGISIAIKNKTTTIKYSHLASSPRPGATNPSKLLEDLQHDIAIIGKIAGHVASLSRTYRILDGKKVNNWYKDVKEVLDRETEIANMNWIELSVPVRGGMKDEDRIRCLFNVHSPDKKLEWTCELDNTKLRLSGNNNPGWYLQEESNYAGETAMLRRTLPLIANMLPLFMIEAKYSIQCVLEIFMALKPVLWVFSGNEHIGLITLMEMNMSSVPHVVESFVACEARICCAELVKDNGVQLTAPYVQNASVWVGTMAGIIVIFDPHTEDRRPVASICLKDSVVSLKFSRNRVFAGLANGTLACFRRKVDGVWDLLNPTVVCLGSQSVLSLSEAGKKLWCACSSVIHILDTGTLGIEKQIEASETSGKGLVKHLVTYGIGVWMSLWRSSKLQLYHAETLELLQTINITTPITRMKNDVDGRIQSINIEKVYVTALLAKEGLLWVGVNSGLIITYPLPKLGGIPTVSGQACVSFHAHEGPVKHLHSFKVHKSIKQRHPGDELPVVKSLFYVDMFSDSVSEFEASSETLDVDEPVYFTVEPETDYKLEPETDDKLLKSKVFVDTNETESGAITGGNVLEQNIQNEVNNKVTAENIRDNDENLIRRSTYDSDDEIHADQEFSFIEDEHNSYKASKGRLQQLTMDCNKNKATVLSSNLPLIKENDFIDMMESFVGFETIPKQTSTPLSKSKISNKDDLSMDAKAARVSTELYESETSNDKSVDGPLDENAKPSVDLLGDAKKCYSVDEAIVLLELDPGYNSALAAYQGKCNGASDMSDATEDDVSIATEENGVPLQAGLKVIVTESSPELPSTVSINKGTKMNISSKVLEVADEKEDDLNDYNRFQSDSGYELPIEPFDTVTVSYARVDKSQKKDVEQKAEEIEDNKEYLNDVKENTKIIQGIKTNLNECVVVSEIPRGLYDQYKSLPFPHRPNSIPNTPQKSDSKKSVESNNDYTPLMQDSISNSLTSTIGMSAYDRDISLTASSLVREPNDSYYASLVVDTKQEEKCRRKNLLKPWYVVSVGVGHIDLRKRPKATGGLDFFKSFSSTDPGPLLIIWKLV